MTRWAPGGVRHKEIITLGLAKHNDSKTLVAGKICTNPSLLSAEQMVHL